MFTVLIQRAVSLGDVETLIQQPASMIHNTYTEEERAAHGISEGLIRISAGLENIADVLQVLEQALMRGFYFCHQTSGTKPTESP